MHVHVVKSQLIFQDEYNDSHGGKWTVENLRLFLESTRGQEVGPVNFIDLISSYMYVHVISFLGPVPTAFQCCVEKL